MGRHRDRTPGRPVLPGGRSRTAAPDRKRGPRVIDLVADRFPGSLLALDTAGPGIVDHQNQHGALSKAEARMSWACADPIRLGDCRPGTQVLASHTLSSLPPRMYDELPPA
ncbi:hypothetical protein ABTZ21_12535 [Streptomyces sp. NPDC096191]|uniref:hypothetical protein n=1 Tax=Streptomyces sp. NPDC096191 TaxID=3155426 RepID=UPI003317AB4B